MFGQNTITGLLLFQDTENVLYRIIAILILILVLYKHSLCHRILEQGLLLFQDKENVFIEIIAILILILVLSKHSLRHRIREQVLVLFQDKENVWIELILEQGLLLFQDKENVFYRNNSNPYSDIISRTNRIFCIEIIAILILISFLSKHSLCPRILEHGLLLFQDKENVLYRNNSNPYSDISSIQTFSLSQNTRTGITIILGQRECLDRNNTRIGITIILGQRECFLQK